MRLVLLLTSAPSRAARPTEAELEAAGTVLRQVAVPVPAIVGPPVVPHCGRRLWKGLPSSVRRGGALEWVRSLLHPPGPEVLVEVDGNCVRIGRENEEADMDLRGVASEPPVPKSS